MEGAGSIFKSLGRKISQNRLDFSPRSHKAHEEDTKFFILSRV